MIAGLTSAEDWRGGASSTLARDAQLRHATSAMAETTRTGAAAATTVVRDGFRLPVEDSPAARADMSANRFCGSPASDFITAADNGSGMLRLNVRGGSMAPTGTWPVSNS